MCIDGGSPVSAPYGVYLSENARSATLSALHHHHPMPGLFHQRLSLLGTRDRAGSGLAVASLVILLVHWVTVLWFVVPRLGTLDFLRLHSTAGLGIDWVGTWWYIFVYPSAGFVVFVVNAFLAALLSRRHRLFGIVVIGATFATEVFLAIGGIIAVMLNR